ncbi:ABC transporter permease [Streptomyces sp. NPDC015130]|uniref:ABC transporter permease n=1 Tax=Streptomyces sp. NPDC015130 TaxID=3364940 RepID=UPI0036F530DD
MTAVKDALVLARRLLAVGRVAGRRTEAGGVRFVALFLAALVLALGLGSLVAVHAVYAGKEERRAGRAAWMAAEEGGARAADVTAWLVHSDTLDGERSFPLVYMAPHRGDAPLPPGLDRWPEPGEVFLSPELRRAGADEGIDHRYGRLAGTIGEEGLDEPSEWLAYVRPRDGLAGERDAELVTGFGPAGAARAGFDRDVGFGQGNDKDEWMFQAVVCGLLVLPAAVLLVVAARTGAHTRDRRTALVTALGGRRRDRALIAVGEAGPAAVLGAVAGAAVIGAALVGDVRIPYTDYLLSSSYLRHFGWTAAGLVPLAALLLVSAAVVVADLAPRRGASGTRPRGTSRGSWLPRLAVLCPVWILLAAYGPGFAPDPVSRMAASWTGIAGTVLTLPAALATVTAGAGRLLTRRARAHDLPGTLVAGRRASAHPGATARLVSGISVALIVLMQAVAWQGIFGGQAAEAGRAADRMDRSVLSVAPRGDVSAAAVASFLDGADGADGADGTNSADGAHGADSAVGAARPGRAPGTEAVLLAPRSGYRGATTSVTLDGDCPALIALRLPCPAREARLDGFPTGSGLVELFRWTPYEDAALLIRRADAGTLAERAAASADGEESRLVLVRPDGQPLSVPVLKRLSHEAFPRGAAFWGPQEGDLTAGAANRDQGRWSVLFGLAGIAVLAATAGLGAVAEFLRHGRALAPLSVLTGGLRVFRTSAAWAVLAPLALAGTAGTGVAAVLAAPITGGDASHITAGVILSATGVVLAVSVLLWVWASHVAVRQARSWRPGGD